jgi:ATP-dependent Lhr-like helicase
MEALWELVWAGLLTNDTLHPLRSLLYPPETKRALSNGSEARPGSVEFLRHLRLRRAGSGVADGRWSLVVRGETSPTQWTANVAQQILARHGIVTRETALAENIPGGYNTLYPAFRAMEESGRIRRGMFVAGLGAAQFAMPAAIDMLRGLRTQPAVPDLVHLASSDPANPYGAVLPWPRAEDDGEGAGPHSMTRAAGASVILLNGRLTGFLRRRSSSIRIFLPDDEPEASQFARGLANKLAEIALERQTLRQGLFIEKINDLPAHDHFLGRFLEPAGFVKTMTGFQMRRVARSLSPVDAGFSETEDEVDAGEVGAGEVEESA